MRYKQTVLGISWAILQPLAIMLVFTLLFSIIVKIPSDGAPYSVFAYSAVLAWTFFSTAVASGVNSLVSHSQLIVHGYPPFSHARRAALIVLFPLHERWFFGDGAHTIRGATSAPLKRAYHNWEWSRRFESYETKAAISDFTRMWTKRRWGIDCPVIYPPVDTSFPILQRPKRS